MTGFASSLSTIWRLAIPYFRSEDRWAGRLLLSALIATELSLVGITVLLNQWYNTFYNSLQERNWDVFIIQLLYYCLLAAAATVLQVYQLYLNQWLQIRWRRWMTKVYLSHWLERATHYRMQLFGDAADNPDQRIAEDIRLFIERALDHRYRAPQRDRNACLLRGDSLGAFGRSAVAPCSGRRSRSRAISCGRRLSMRSVGTALTHLIGWPLVQLNFNQQRYEADFRFNLVRVRENSEQIALLTGETAESDRLLARFGKVASNWHLIMSRQKRLTFFTTAYNRFALVFPFIVVSPAYFAGSMQLGGLVQTAGAFGSVQTALSFFVTVYRDLAEWRAVIERSGRFRSLDRDSTRDRPAVSTAPAGRCRTLRRDKNGAHDRRVVGPPAKRRAARCNRRPLHRGGWARPGHRPVRLRKVDVLPRDRRPVAVRNGHRQGAAWRQADDAAAASLFPVGQPRSGGELSIRTWRVPARAHGASAASPSDCRRWHTGSPTRCTGTRYCRWANSSASASLAQSCKRPIICSWTRPRPLSMRRRKPSFTYCCRKRFHARRSSRSVTARRSSHSTIGI